MNGNVASDWAEEFNGKDLGYFEDYNPPPGLEDNQLCEYEAAWKRAKWSLIRQAREAADTERAKAEAQSADDAAERNRPAFARAAAELRASCGWEQDDESDEPEPPPALPVPAPAPITAEIIPATPLVRPAGDAAQQLEHQLGTCSALIGTIADYIASSSSHPDICLNFMDRITSMMRSSAAAGKVVGKLRGDAPEETRHRVIVEHAAPRGEGVLRA